MIGKLCKKNNIVSGIFFYSIPQSAGRWSTAMVSHGNGSDRLATLLIGVSHVARIMVDEPLKGVEGEFEFRQKWLKVSTLVDEIYEDMYGEPNVKVKLDSHNL
jgi:hypothetical protein